MEHEIEIEHHTGTNKRIGILIAIMAAVLAFTEMAARNADTDVVRETVEASDTWAFYQAKAIRAAMLRADARALQAAQTKDPAMVAQTVAEWEATAAREDSEPSTSEGRKELAVRAQSIEKRRDDRNAAKESFEYASGGLELGILLASSAVVTGMLPLAFLGAGMGALGTIAGILGWTAPHILGG